MSATPEIPSTAFAVELDELIDFEISTAGELRGCPLHEVDVVRSNFRRDGFDYAGYLLPKDRDSSSFLMGWFAGRRSASKAKWLLHRRRARRAAGVVA